MIENILLTCKCIPKNNIRNIIRSILKLQEEVGELSQEVNIYLGNLPEKKIGKDGILGEVCDIIIASLDVLYLYNPNIDPKVIEETVRLKLEKWTNSTKQD